MGSITNTCGGRREPIGRISGRHRAWEDRDSGKQMAGRGLEVWRMRDGMIAVWDAAFNVWEKDGPRVSSVM